MRLSTIVLAAGALAAPLAAHAATWFEIESGFALQHDQGQDGIWIQQGAPNFEHRIAPAFGIGLGSNLYSQGRWGVDGHLDLLYVGNTSAGCTCVPDSGYDPAAHKLVGVTPSGQWATFYGQGSSFGIRAVVEPYVWVGGWKLGVNGGMYIQRATWTETITPVGGPSTTVSHKPTIQPTWTVGASISRGPWTARYTYFNKKTTWNPYPGFYSTTHLFTLQYSF